jgi:hypothetical protein
LLIAHAGGTSTQCDDGGPASAPEQSVTHTCVGAHVAVPHGALARALVVHVPLAQRTTTPATPLPTGGIEPSSVCTVPEAQPHAGYCASQIDSALVNRASSEVAMPIAVMVPQQSVACWAMVQSTSRAQWRSKVGNDVASWPLQTMPESAMTTASVTAASLTAASIGVVDCPQPIDAISEQAIHRVRALCIRHPRASRVPMEWHSLRRPEEKTMRTLALALILIAGCSQSTTPSSLDGSPTTDGGNDAAIVGDVGPLCGGGTFGFCANGATCLACPTGPIMQTTYCSRHCTSDTDCTDATYPTCSRDPSGTESVCVPTGMTCAWGVRCASPDTMIATPSGERAIADLVIGDLVFSADDGMLRAVPLAMIHRTPVTSDHRIVRVVLESGRVLEISPGHPTADGRTFADLRAGDTLDGARIVSAEITPYLHSFTYDVLPASDTGTYVAGGVLIGSTLASSNAPVALVSH